SWVQRCGSERIAGRLACRRATAASAEVEQKRAQAENCAGHKQETSGTHRRNSLPLPYCVLPNSNPVGDVSTRGRGIFHGSARDKSDSQALGSFAEIGSEGGVVLLRDFRELPMAATPATIISTRIDFFEHGYTFRVSALFRVSATKPSSFNDSRLISTFASAPSRAAFARAIAVVRSDFMFGLVIGFRLVAICATSTTFPATPKGTLVACLSAAAIAAAPSLVLAVASALPSDDLADL